MVLILGFSALFLTLYVINYCLMVLIVQNILGFHKHACISPQRRFGGNPWCEVAWISYLITFAINNWVTSSGLHPHDSRDGPPIRILFQDYSMAIRLIYSLWVLPKRDRYLTWLLQISRVDITITFIYYYLTLHIESQA